MKIIWNSRYKSIDTLMVEVDNLPNFTLLSGLNGTGKTHLLECIADLSRDNYLEINGAAAKAQYYNSETLKPNNETAHDHKKSIEQEISLLFDIIAEIKRNDGDMTTVQLSHEFGVSEEVAKKSKTEIISELTTDEIRDFNNEEFEEKWATFWAENSIHIKNKITQTLQKANAEVNAADSAPMQVQRGTAVQHRPKVSDLTRARKQLLLDLNSSQTRLPHILEAIEHTSTKPLFLIEKEEFEHNFPVGLLVDPFRKSYTTWVRRYLRLYKNNSELYAAKISGISSEVEASSPEDFLRDRVPPWVSTNQLLKDAGLGFKLAAPQSFRLDAEYVAKLVDDETEAEVSFGDLSSGEKTIFSLITALSFSEDLTLSPDAPAILLLDEVDAHLHPSLTKFLINVVDNYLVKKLGLKVIMTSHSPSTIAIAREDCLYKMEKDGVKKKIIKMSKDEGIKILTAGVPTLSIFFNKRRLVLTESYKDANIYDTLFDAWSKYLGPELEMTPFFHSSGGTARVSGDKGLVKKHIKAFIESNNKTVVGIIDWDGKEKSKKQLFVLAEDRRSAIENLILDPICLAAFMLSLDHVKNPEELGLPPEFQVSELKSQSGSELQCVVDAIITKLGIAPSDAVRCRYINGVELNIPRAFLSHAPHKLENLVTEKYPPLKSHRDKLLQDIASKIAREFPGLIPAELGSLFEALSNSSL